MVDEIDPRQPFLRVNILRWREIFRVIETSSSNVDLIGAFVVLIGQRRSTTTAKRPQRSRLRPILAWRSFSRIGTANVLLRSRLLPELRRLAGSFHNDNSSEH
jgi:hypothetical protein